MSGAATTPVAIVHLGRGSEGRKTSMCGDTQLGIIRHSRCTKGAIGRGRGEREIQRSVSSGRGSMVSAERTTKAARAAAK